MKDLPQFTPGWDEQMREFHKSFGIDPRVTQRAIEMRRRNPAGEDADVENARPVNQTSKPPQRRPRRA